MATTNRTLKNMPTAGLLATGEPINPRDPRLLRSHPVAYSQCAGFLFSTLSGRRCLDFSIPWTHAHPPNDAAYIELVTVNGIVRMVCFDREDRYIRPASLCPFCSWYTFSHGSCGCRYDPLELLFRALDQGSPFDPFDPVTNLVRSNRRLLCPRVQRLVLASPRGVSFDFRHRVDLLRRTYRRGGEAHLREVLPQGRTKRDGHPTTILTRMSARERERLANINGPDGIMARENRRRRLQSEADKAVHAALEQARQVPIPEQRTYLEKVCNAYDGLDLTGDLDLVREIIQFGKEPTDFFELKHFNRLCALLQKISARQTALPQGFFDNLTDFAKKTFASIVDGARDRTDALKKKFQTVSDALALGEEARNRLQKCFDLYKTAEAWWGENGPYIKLLVYVPMAAAVFWYSRDEPIHITLYSVLFSALVGPELLTLLTRLFSKSWAQPITTVEEEVKSDSQVAEAVPLSSPDLSGVGNKKSLLDTVKEVLSRNSPLAIDPFHDTPEVKPQGLNILESLFHVVSELLGIVPTTMAPNVQVAEALKLVNLANSVSTFLGRFYNLIQNVVSWVVGSVTRVALSIPILKDYVLVDADAKMAQDILNRPVSTESFDRSFATEALAWHETLLARAARHRTAGDTRFSAALMDYYRLCYDQITAYRRQLSAASMRMEPLVIHMLGKPGVGKSTLIQLILAKIYPALYGRAFEPAEAYVVSSNPEYPYHDGYIAQPVIIAEEKFSSIDSVSVSATIDWLLHLVSGNPAPADQAALPLKGMVHFVPDMVFLTDNNIDTSGATKTNVDALVRRIKIPVEVLAGSGGLQLDQKDPAKVVAALKEYRFRMKRAKTQERLYTYEDTDEFLSFDQLCQYIINQVHGNDQKFRNLSSTVASIASQAYEEWEARNAAPVLERNVDPQMVIVKLPKGDPKRELTSSPGFKWLEEQFPDTLDLVITESDPYPASAEEALRLLKEDSKRKLDPVDLRAMMIHYVHNFNFRTQVDQYRGVVPVMTESVVDRLMTTRERLLVAAKFVRQTSASVFESCVLPILPYLKTLGIIIGAGAVGWAVGTLLNHLFGAKYTVEFEAVEQAYAGKDAAPAKRRTFISPLAKLGKQPTRTVSAVVSQAGHTLSDDRQDLVTRTFFPNMLSVDVVADLEPGEKTYCDAQMLALNDTTLIGPSHIFAVAIARRETAYLEFTIGPASKVKHRVPLNETNVTMHVPDDDTDLIVLRLALPLPHIRKCTQHFIPEKFWPIFDKVSCSLFKRTSDGMGAYVPVSNVRPDSVTTAVPYSAGHIETLHAWRYDGLTRGGDCGSLLVSHDPTAPGLVFGLHIAGDGVSTGYSVALSREYVDECLSLSRPPYSVASPGEVPQERLPYVPLTMKEMETLPQCVQGLPILGKVVPGRALYSPENTSLRPSLIAEDFPCESLPAKLGRFYIDGEPRWYWSASIGVYRDKVVTFNRDPRASQGFGILDEAYLRKKVGVSKLDWHEALNGNEYLPPLETTTSNGDYRIPEGKPKSAYLYRLVPEGPLTPSPELVTDVDRIDSLLRSTVNDAPLITALAKDELRAPEKVALGQTRLIYPYSLPFTVLTRMYFGSLARHVRELLGTNPVYLGISPETWFLYADQYRKGEIPRSDDDGNKYDINIQPRSALNTIEYVLHWYEAQGASADDQLVRFKLLWNIFFPMIAIHGFVMNLIIFTSGNALTAILNCLRHFLSKSAAFAHFVDSKELATLSNLRHYWKLSIYADDGMQAEDLKICSNEELKQYIYEVFGDVHKSDKNEAEGFGPVFLKRGINSEPPFLFAPLKLQSILNNLHWIRTGLDPADATRQNAETAMREFVHYGRATFDDMLKQVNQSLVRHSLAPLNMRWIDEARKYIRGAKSVSSLPNLKLSTSSGVNLASAQCAIATMGRESLPAFLSKSPVRAVRLADAPVIATASSPSTLPPALDSATPVAIQNSLVTSQVTAPIEKRSEKPTYDPRAANPFPATGLEDVLGRQYQVATLTWPVAFAAGSVLSTIQFPEVFLTFPQFVDRIKGYTLYRAGVKINISTTCPFGSMGSILVSWIPCAGLNNLRTHSLRAQSSANTAVLSASKNETVELEFHWSAPVAFGTVALMGTNEQAAIGELKISVLNQLDITSDAPPTSASVSVLARLTDVVVTGYDPSAAPPPLSAVRKARETQPPGVHTQGRTKVESINQGGSVQVSEAESEGGSGVLSTISGAVASTAPLFAAVPGVGGLAMAAGATAGILTPIFRSLGLARPDSMETVGRFVSDDYRSEFAPVRGQFNAPKIAGSQAAYLKTTPGIIGSGSLDTTVLDVCRIPGLLESRTFTSANVVGTLLASWPVHPCNVQTTTHSGTDVYDWIPINYARLYAQYRGSIDFCFQFVTSVTTNARFKIVLCYGSAPPASIADYSGDAPSVNVDVRGDVETKIRVPFLFQQTYARTCDPLDPSLLLSLTSSEIPAVLGIYLLTPVNAQVISAAPKIYLNVWTAAGPDFQLAHPIGYFATLYNPFAAKFKKDPKTLGKKDVDTRAHRALPQGVMRSVFTQITSDFTATHLSVEGSLVSSEELVGVNELLRRFRDHTDVTPDNTVLDFLLPRKCVATGFAASSFALQGIAHLAIAFLGYRGSVRALVMSTAGYGAYPLFGDYNAFGQSFAAQYGVTVPYLDRVNYIPTWFGTEWENSNNTNFSIPRFKVNQPAAGYTYLAAGDDGVVATYLPPPPIVVPTTEQLKERCLAIERGEAYKLVMKQAASVERPVLGHSRL